MNRPFWIALAAAAAVILPVFALIETNGDLAALDPHFLLTGPKPDADRIEYFRQHRADFQQLIQLLGIDGHDHGPESPDYQNPTLLQLEQNLGYSGMNASEREGYWSLDKHEHKDAILISPYPRQPKIWLEHPRHMWVEKSYAYCTVRNGQGERPCERNDLFTGYRQLVSQLDTPPPELSKEKAGGDCALRPIEPRWYLVLCTTIDNVDY
jgi:hypothetical protein